MPPTDGDQNIEQSSQTEEVIHSEEPNTSPPNPDLVSGDSNAQSALLDSYDIFISHASRGSNDVIPLEKEFVEQLADHLKDPKYNLKVFVDFIDDTGMNTHLIHVALTRSKHFVLICSPRYLKQFNSENSTPLVTEVEYVAKKESNGTLCSIPVLFGVTDQEFDNEMAPFAGKYKAKSLYKNENISEEITLDEIIIDIIEKILTRIKAINP